MKKNFVQQPIIEKLLKGFKKKKVLERVNTLKALADINNPKVVDEMIKALSDHSPTVRSVAAECLGLMGNNTAIDPLIEKLSDTNSEVRMMAARSLGELLTNKSCPSALISKLNDPDELVKIEACESIGLIGDRKALPALWRTINDPSSLLRSYIAATIGELGNRTDIPKLEKQLKREDSDEAKVGFYQALYKLGQLDALPQLITLLQSRDYRVRCATANTLTTLVNKSTAPLVLSALRKALNNEKTVAAKSSIQSSLKSINKQFSIEQEVQ